MASRIWRPLGLFVAPLVLVKLHQRTDGARVSCYLCARLALRLTHRARRSRADGAEVCRDRVEASRAGRTLADVLRFRNVYLCVVLVCCFTAYVNIGVTFYPRFISA